MRLLPAIVALTVLCAAGCTKNQDDTSHHPDKVFVDSQTPPGLSPQHFPPAGFVWSGFKSGNLPEARYGVAAPPTNPGADILIVADARFPAEAYFELAGDLISLNYTVWIYEAPGQGGSGRYFLQGDKIHTPDFHHSVQAVEDLVSKVIRPSSVRPVYIVGTGTGALTALSIDPKTIPIGGIIAYSPYLRPPEPAPTGWRGENVPSDEWAQTAHKWQRANPDLRLRSVSQTWQIEMDKAVGNVTSRGLKGLNFGREAPRRLIITGEEAAPPNDAGRICAGIKTCSTKRIFKNKDLSAEINKFIEQTHTQTTLR
ncbi:alpha/beta hydrolase [Asticcacaulis sp. SL142]|jgi:Serine aminopeptidase, S33|uniref:alpha/beta hydrolase n=1 Tax=Asticcacaulis sp. SL142 TaxID=2995155 RepID=UPI00226CD64E|nr:alpha/beta fold hydrolase [Asticcacaulis sp. SL142]WAC48927.1 alpha/beta hydrolase [Asticcacaulis sp. SL142]